VLFYPLAIKTGRYTYAKKAKDLMEVRGLKVQDLVTSKARPPDLDTMYQSNLPTVERPSRSERPSSPVLTADEMDGIIQRITSVQSTLCCLTPDFLERQSKNVKHYLVIGFAITLLARSIID
jgi:hypothetical protein